MTAYLIGAGLLIGALVAMVYRHALDAATSHLRRDHRRKQPKAPRQPDHNATSLWQVRK